MTNAQLKSLIKTLESKAEHWRTTRDDPHGISVAVYVAIKEIVEAVKKATK